MAGIVLFLLIFWLGLMANFPGEALSRLIEAKAAQTPAIKLSLSPAEMNFFGVSLPSCKVEWRRPNSPVMLLSLKEVYIPISWRLFSGLPMEVAMGEEGLLNLFLAWEGGEVEIEGSGIRLEDIPAWNALAPLRVKGGLEFAGNMKFQPPAKGKFTSGVPSGEINGKAVNLEISNLVVLGNKLPAARLESLDLKVKSGKRIVVERFNFRGDMQGNLTGTIIPRGGRWENSSLQLKIKSSIRQSWLQGLGALQPLVESFLNQGRLDGSLTGTIARPKWRKTNRS